MRAVAVMRPLDKTVDSVTVEGIVTVGGGVQLDALTNAQLRAAPVAVSGPLTDTQLRAAPVAVTAVNLPLKTIETDLVGTDMAVVTNTVIHGKTTAGHGAYVDVKVNPSGSLAVDASGSVVDLSAATLAALENTTVTVANFPAVQAVSATDLDIRNLTAAQDSVELGPASLAALESVTVSGTVELGATTLAALENTTVTVANFPAVQTVAASDLDIRNLTAAQDSVELGPVSLAALENVTAIVDGPVALDAATLAALENITVSATDLDIRNLTAAQDSVELGPVSLAALENVGVTGTVELGATTLAALESVSVTGTVELGATTLAALENTTVTVANFPAVQAVSATDLDIRNLTAAQDSVELGPVSLAALENVGVTGTVELGATTLAALESVTVSATDLDIRNLTATQDSVELGPVSLAALENTTTTVANFPAVQAVSATDLDIRNLSAAQDNVVAFQALVPVGYDGIELSYTGEDLTGVVYKQGLTTVATLALAYTGGKLTSVARV